MLLKAALLSVPLLTPAPQLYMASNSGDRIWVPRSTLELDAIALGQNHNFHAFWLLFIFRSFLISLRLNSECARALQQSLQSEH